MTTTDKTTPPTDPPAPDPAPATDPPAGGDSPVTAERFAALESMVSELATLLRGPSSTGGGEGGGSAAVSGSSPSPVPTDRGSIRDIVRDLLADGDREQRIGAMADELAQLRATVEAGLTPPKRGWGSWIVGSR